MSTSNCTCTDPCICYSQKGSHLLSLLAVPWALQLCIVEAMTTWLQDILALIHRLLSAPYTKLCILHCVQVCMTNTSCELRDNACVRRWHTRGRTVLQSLSCCWFYYVMLNINLADIVAIITMLALRLLVCTTMHVLGCKWYVVCFKCREALWTVPLLLPPSLPTPQNRQLTLIPSTHTRVQRISALLDFLYQLYLVFSVRHVICVNVYLFYLCCIILWYASSYYKECSICISCFHVHAAIFVAPSFTACL